MSPKLHMMKPVSTRLCQASVRHGLAPHAARFTERQARFLVHVLVFSGVLIERQYAPSRASRMARRHMTSSPSSSQTATPRRSLLARCTAASISRPVQTLYELSESRITATEGRLAGALRRAIDALGRGARGPSLRLAGHREDKRTYFREALERDLPDDWYPHLTFGSAPRKRRASFRQAASPVPGSFTPRLA